MCPKPRCKKDNMRLHPSDWYLSKLQLDDSACRDAAREFLAEVFNSSDSENSCYSDDNEDGDEDEESEATRSNEYHFSVDDPFCRRESIKPYKRFYEELLSAQESFLKATKNFDDDSSYSHNDQAIRDITDEILDKIDDLRSYFK